MKKVVKFGGSSLASAEQFKKVGKIIHADDSRVYVVPSAPGKRFDGDTKVTDMLLHAYQTASEGNDVDEELKAIKARYDEIITGLELKDFSLDDDFAEIKKNLAENPQSDYAASRGEYLNGKVMAAYLGIPFIDSAEVIFFNEEGNLNDYKTYKRLTERLAQNERAVIPGFYGMGKDGNVKTFSRGGSDVTGSIVARASRADVYENWTDVSGFLVADPRIVPDPKPIKYITYRELRELSYMGASVLHEDAIFPVSIQTLQQQERAAPLQKRHLQAFEENNISFEHMPSGIDTMTIVVHADEFIDKEQSVVSAIHRLAEPDSVEIESGLALIAVVGRGMKSASGTAGKLFTALANKGINIKMIDQGSSELNIIIGVENRDFETAIKAIYSTFITK